MDIPRQHVSSLVGILAGAFYGAVCRLALGNRGTSFAQFLVPAMSIAFLFLVPAGLGALTVYLGAEGKRRSIPHALFMPWVSCALTLLALVALAWEGWICIVLGAPVFLIMASLGGLVACLGFRAGKVHGPYGVTALVLLPFLMAPIERHLAEPATLETVTTRTFVAADATAVWRHVVRVPRIGPDELTPSFFHRIGFPRPVEASLAGTGVGAVRTARFEKGLTFREPIDVWETERRLSFTIQVDRATLSPTVLDEHVAVGGPYFDVLRGTFTLEPRPGGTLLLLTSTHRVSTRFNGYATAWSRAIMADLQERICGVIRARAEKEPR